MLLLICYISCVVKEGGCGCVCVFMRERERVEREREREREREYIYINIYMCVYTCVAMTGDILMSYFCGYVSSEFLLNFMHVFLNSCLHVYGVCP